MRIAKAPEADSAVLLTGLEVYKLAGGGAALL